VEKRKLGFYISLIGVLGYSGRLSPAANPVFIPVKYVGCFVWGTLANAVDMDKYHEGDGGWSQNWFNDKNGNGKHDPREPFGDTADPTWAHPVLAKDNSCWLASAANMLQQLGMIPDASALYGGIALNGVYGYTSWLTWDDSSLQEMVFGNWQETHEGTSLIYDVHQQSKVMLANGIYGWEDWNPREEVARYLREGWQVGIGLWRLNTTTRMHGTGHALTFQAINPDMTFDCTDSDRDWDWMGFGDIERYHDAVLDPVVKNGHTYYGWYTDFYTGDMNDEMLGDIGYVCAIIPEPLTLALLGSGALALAGRQSGLGRRRAALNSARSCCRAWSPR
jgi:hypothetical protein